MLVIDDTALARNASRLYLKGNATGSIGEGMLALVGQAPPSNVIDFRTRKPFYPPGNLERTLQNIDAVRRAQTEPEYG